MRSSTATPPHSSSTPSGLPGRGALIVHGQRAHVSEHDSGPLEALQALALRPQEPETSRPRTSTRHEREGSELDALSLASVPQRERSPSRGHPSIRHDGQESHITRLRPEDARRSRRQVGGQRLYLTSSREVVLSLPGQRTFMQSNRPLDSRNSRSRQSSSQSTRAHGMAPSTTSSVHDGDLPEPIAGGPPFDILSGIIVSIADAVDDSEGRRAREHAKKERQVRRWIDEVLPSLLRPFLYLLRTSKSLRSVERGSTPTCQCLQEGARNLTVICIFFDRAYLVSHLLCVV